MSTLTKILIILLTISSIFLCGIVVTYVANADNYKELYDKERNNRKDAITKKDSAEKQLEERKTKYQQQEDKLNGKIASLEEDLKELQAKLVDIEREKANLLVRVESWTSITKDFYETTDKQGQLLKNTLDELNRVKAEQIKLHKELDETTASLEEKIAIIAMLDAKTKRLLEERFELQSKLDEFLKPIGKLADVAEPVTPKKTLVRPAMPAVKDIALKGLVTAVDLKNSMASISIGTADGVKEGMKFYATRGDEFICEILIIDVDTEEAVGVLERVQHQPKAGDNVSTNL